MQNKKTESESEFEEGGVEDEESDFENQDTSERNGYRPIVLSPEDEITLHTDGEMKTGGKKIKREFTKYQSNRRCNQQSKQPKRYRGVTYTQNIWV